MMIQVFRKDAKLYQEVQLQSISPINEMNIESCMKTRVNFQCLRFGRAKGEEAVSRDETRMR